MKYSVQRGSNGFANHHRLTLLSRLMMVTIGLISSLIYFIRCYFLLMPFIIFWFVVIGIAFYDVPAADYLSAPRELIYNCLLINLAISAAAMLYRLGRGQSSTGKHSASYSDRSA